MRAPHSPSSTSSRPLTAPRLRGTCSIVVMAFTPCGWLRTLRAHGYPRERSLCGGARSRNAGLARRAWVRRPPAAGRSVTGEAPVAEAGAAPGVGLGRRLVAGDPAGDHLRGDRGHEDAGPEVPRGQPRVAEAWHPVDDRAPVRMTRPEAAPLVGGLQAADRRQGGVQGLEDGFDHLGLYLRGFVAGVEGAPH